MYVCICKAVTDKQIRQFVGEGVASYAELQKTLSVGLQCGKCSDEVREILEEAMVESASRRQSVAAVTLKLIRA